MSMQSRKKLTEMSTEEFFEHGFDSDVSTGDEDNVAKGSDSPKKLDIKQRKTKTGSTSQHKQQLEKLKDKDPEFYKFLQENDSELLDFENMSSGSDDDGDEDEGEEDGDDKEKVGSEGDEDESEDENEKDLDMKTPTRKDSSDEEDLDDAEMEDAINDKTPMPDRELITLKMVAKWKKGLEKKSLFSLRQIMRAFHGAVVEAIGTDEDRNKDSVRYTVDGAIVFNNLIQLCIKSCFDVLQHHLSKEKKSKPGKRPPLPSSSQQWSKVKVTIKLYLQDVLQLLRHLPDPAMLAVILKHSQDMTPYYACFPKIAKMFIKRLIRMWSSGEEHVRVLAFLCIRRIMTLMPQLSEFILKKLYLGYVKNSKFFNPKTKPAIVFMQNSLVEIFSMDLAMTYQLAFVYIRQLAIHLRNAMTMKKKDPYQSVYNWQYISCLLLWCRVLSELPGETLAPLIFPVVQITLGAIRLIPTARYYPLRFHCLRSLNVLSKSTDTYIPIASYLLEILGSPEFNRKAKPSTAKFPDISCLLKFPKPQLHTRGFQDAVMDHVCDVLLEHFVNNSTSIAFPDLIFPAIVRMKRFIKRTKVPKFGKQVKQLADKLEEAAGEIAKRRSSVSFNPKDPIEVKRWENEFGQEKNCLQKFHETWKKMKDLAKVEHDTEDKDFPEDSSEDDDEPKPKRRKKSEGKKPLKSSTKENDTQGKMSNKKNHNVKKEKLKEEKFQFSLSEEKEDIVEDFKFSSDEED